jgi:hypothetical protein
VNPRRARDSQTVVILFVAGAALVVAAFTYALVRQWRTFDPLVTASMIGVGLLLIVIYERLGQMLSQLHTIAYQLERLNLGAPSSGSHGDDRTSSAPHAKAEGGSGVAGPHLPR